MSDVENLKKSQKNGSTLSNFFERRGRNMNDERKS